MEKHEFEEQRIRNAARDIADEREYKKHLNYEKRFGQYGKYILNASTGGGFYSVPDAVDIYERALGLSRDETWLMKRLFKYLPNVYPSMERLAKESGTSESTLSRIKNKLVKRGFVRDLGKRGAVKINGESREVLSHSLDIMPFFTAVFICALCDANSPIAISEVRDMVRDEFYGQEHAGLGELPLTVEQAKYAASGRGIILDWQAIAEMQTGEALEKLEAIAVDKRRELEVKQAIKDGIGDWFKIQYSFGKAYNWLRWLCGTALTSDEIEKLSRSFVRGYAIYREDVKVKTFMHWMENTVSIPDIQGILASKAENGREDLYKTESEIAGLYWAIERVKTEVEYVSIRNGNDLVAQYETR